MTRDTTQAYLNEIGRYPLLTKAQEVLLGTQIQSWLAIQEKDPSLYTREEKRIAKLGQRAKDKFVKSNLRLVVNIARKYLSHCKTLDLMDLIQEGNVGLIRAVEKFDPTRGYAMSTYAYWWIRQAMQRAIQTGDLTIRLPINIHDTTSKIKRTAEVITKEIGREPTIDEIAEESGFSLEEIKIAMQAPRITMSLDKQVNGCEDSTSIIDAICDKKYSNTIDDADQRIKIEDLHVAINSYLDDITKFVILERSKTPPTLWRVLSEETGLSRNRLQTMEKAGINRCALLLRLKNGLEI